MYAVKENQKLCVVGAVTRFWEATAFRISGEKECSWNSTFHLLVQSWAHASSYTIRETEDIKITQSGSVQNLPKEGPEFRKTAREYCEQRLGAASPCQWPNLEHLVTGHTADGTLVMKYLTLRGS